MAPPAAPSVLRGQVWWVDIPDVGEKPAVIVSNNSRNVKLQDVLVARISTSPKPPLPTVIPTHAKNDPINGSVLCDDILPIDKAALRRPAGALCFNTMQAVDDGIRAALRL